MDGRFACGARVSSAAAGVGVTLYRRTTEPFKGYAAAEQFVEIAPGSSTRAIGDALVEAGVGSEFHALGGNRIELRIHNASRSLGFGRSGDHGAVGASLALGVVW